MGSSVRMSYYDVCGIWGQVTFIMRFSGTLLMTGDWKCASRCGKFSVAARNHLESSQLVEVKRQAMNAMQVGTKRPILDGWQSAW